MVRKKVISIILVLIIIFSVINPVYVYTEDNFTAKGTQQFLSGEIKVSDAIMKNLLEYSTKVFEAVGPPLSIESYLKDKAVDEISKSLPGFNSIVLTYNLFKESAYVYSDFGKALALAPTTVKKVLNTTKDTVETSIMSQANLMALVYQLGVKHRNTDNPIPMDHLDNINRTIKNDKKIVDVIYDNTELTLIKYFAKSTRAEMLKMAKALEMQIDSLPSAFVIYNMGRYGSETEPTYDVKNISDGLYSIRKKGTNLSFDVSSYGTAKGTNLQLCTYSSNTAQLFRIENANGAVRIWSVCSPNLVIDIGGNDSSTRKSGTNIDLWTLNADYSKNYWKDQEWALEYKGDGSYLIKPKHYLSLAIGSKGLNVELVNESSNSSITSWIIEPIITSKDNPKEAYLHSTENIGLRVRVSPDGVQIGHLSENLNQTITVFGKSINGWYKVKGIDTSTKRDVFGYSSADYISVKEVQSKDNSKLEQPGAEKAIAWAKDNKGSHNWDYYCTAFVYNAYKAAGVSNTTFGDAKIAGDAYITNRDREPAYGAAVFYDWYGTIPKYGYGNWGHVGIYIGNNQVIHAFGKSGVIISNGLDLPDCTYIGWGIWK